MLPVIGCSGRGRGYSESNTLENRARFVAIVNVS